MIDHIEQIATHFSSGDWEITTNEIAVQNSLRAEYGDPRKWHVHFVGGNSNSFPLATDLREETFQEIGQSTADEGEILNLRRASLPDRYGDFLADSVLALGQNTNSKDAGIIRKFAQDLRSNNSVLEKPSEQLYQRSQKVLARLPDTASLRKALAAYRDKEVTKSQDFSAFHVFSTPPYDNDDLWTAQTRTMNAKTDRCSGMVGPLSNSETLLPAYIERWPRVVTIDLVRSWLSDELLDEVVASDSAVAKNYFSFDGRLSSIPSSLWVLMEDELRVEPVSQKDTDAIRKWTESHECCRLTCADTSLTLSPTSVNSISATQWSGLMSGTTPLLFAIVSTHRVAK